MTFSDPEKNIEQLGIAEGMHVADFGCGSGFYSMSAARKVGPEGRIYAIDVQRDLLDRIKQEAVSEEIKHLDIVWGDVGKSRGSQLGDGAVDIVILSNILFQVENVATVITEAHRILRSGGRMLIIDWKDSFGGLGPHKDHIVSEQSVIEAAKRAGFEIVYEIDAGDHHYGMVVRKAK